LTSQLLSKLHNNQASINTVHVYNDDERAQVLSMMGSMEDVVSPVHHLSIRDVLTSASPSERTNHISTIRVPTSGSQHGGREMKIRFTYSSSEDKHQPFEYLER